MSKVRKSYLLTTVFCAASATAAFGAPGENENAYAVPEDQVEPLAAPMSAGLTLSAVATWALDEAESALLNQVRSVLKNAIFGSSGPDVVHLSEQSLDEIRAIIAAQDLHTESQRFTTEYNAFQTLMHHYNHIVSNGGRDRNLLNDLNVQSAVLVNHHLFRKSFNGSYFAVTEEFSGSAAHRVAVLSEYVTQGYGTTHGYVSSQADDLAVTLGHMGSVADAAVVRDVVVIPPASSCPRDPIISSDPREFTTHNIEAMAPEIRASGRDGNARRSEDVSAQNRTCAYVVRDNIQGRSVRFELHLYGWNLANRSAYQTLNAWRAENKDMFKGTDYHTILSQLNNF